MFDHTGSHLLDLLLAWKHLQYSWHLLSLLPGRRARENTDKAALPLTGSRQHVLRQVVGQLSDEKYIIRAKASSPLVGATLLGPCSRRLPRLWQRLGTSRALASTSFPSSCRRNLTSCLCLPGARGAVRTRALRSSQQQLSRLQRRDLGSGCLQDDWKKAWGPEARRRWRRVLQQGMCQTARAIGFCKVPAGWLPNPARFLIC